MKGKGEGWEGAEAAFSKGGIEETDVSEETEGEGEKVRHLGRPDG